MKGKEQFCKISHSRKLIFECVGDIIFLSMKKLAILGLAKPKFFYTFLMVFILIECNEARITHLCPDLRPLSIGWISQDAACPLTAFSGI
jgi:hypothetical protein